MANHAPPEQSLPRHAPSGDELLTASQLHELLPLSEPTLRHWRYIGAGPEWVTLGRRVFYRRRSVLRWIEEQERQQRLERETRRAAR